MTVSFVFVGKIIRQVQPNSHKLPTLPRFLIIKDIRLSLLSFSSFLFSFSALTLAFSASLSDLALSLALSLASECRLRRDVDLSNEGIPRLSTEDFFEAELGTDVDKAA